MNTTIKQNKRGGWSICFKGRSLGNYPTAADAARIARLNGYNDRSAPALTPARPSSNTTTATTATAVCRTNKTRTF